MRKYILFFLLIPWVALAEPDSVTLQCANVTTGTITQVDDSDFRITGYVKSIQYTQSVTNSITWNVSTVAAVGGSIVAQTVLSEATQAQSSEVYYPTVVENVNTSGALQSAPATKEFALVAETLRLSVTAVADVTNTITVVVYYDSQP